MSTRKSEFTPCGKNAKMPWPVGWASLSLACTTSVRCSFSWRYSRIRTNIQWPRENASSGAPVRYSDPSVSTSAIQLTSASAMSDANTWTGSADHSNAPTASGERTVHR